MMTTETSSSSTETHSRRISVLFSKFAAFYGHVWRSQFKDEGFMTFAKKEWEEGLHAFSDAVLNKAILNCRDFYELPPTLPQLIRCCRDINKQNDFFVAVVDPAPVNPEVVKHHLQQCFAILQRKQRGE